MDQSPEDDLAGGNDKDIQKPHKRKRDTEGFVCPTTPDIPKSSHLYMENKNRGKMKGLDSIKRFPNFSSDFIQPDMDNEAESCYFKPISDEKEQYGTYSMGENFNQYENTPFPGDIQDGLTSGMQETGEVTHSETYDVGSGPNEEGAATQEGSGSLLQSLLKDFEQESSTMFENWSKIFRQSEEYETSCQQKLSGLMHGAKSIDESLNSKKNILCNKLKGIGKTLET